MKRIILSIVFLTLCISVPITAQETQPSESSVETYGDHKDRFYKGHGHRRAKMAERMFGKLDTNEDGKVDLNEFLAQSEQRFQRMDLNSDGYVTVEESREAGKAMREKHREAMKEARKAYRESKQEGSIDEDR